MHAHRFFSDSPLAAGQRLALPEEEARHVARVLRLAAGAEVVLFDGEGNEALARIAMERRGSVEVDVHEVRRGPEAPTPRIHLLVPWMKQPARLDWVLEKAAELGVGEVTVFGAPLSQERARQERWRRLAVAAAKQSGQARLMRVSAQPDELPWLLAAESRRLLLSEKEGAPPLRSTLSDVEEVALAVGPEEGFSAAEEAQAAEAGWVRASLGPLRLRVETAAIAAVAGVRVVSDWVRGSDSEPCA